ncbi:acyl-CoA thioester hydrolase [Microlunatus sagamiharensis]|uniref:Acyl-CoA thioester hydrolase n=1 Tax=Microlunatus sagamiharensis TaxID=546874 RepID=A0A1H2LPF8_9ACTN|nr:thioesterase family protein [Microlunatus sagamiharensis]SDU82635.1 acyl-CoA thioester hydrolase [Microlunatus sagamiharensis]
MTEPAAAPTRFVHRSPRRWGDLDAQGHVNNAVYLDHLQDARVAFLHAGAEGLADMLTTGVLVVSHQVEYVAPVGYGPEPLEVSVWIDALGASRFVVGYDVLDSGRVAARARTALVPFDLAGGGMRRLHEVERAAFAAYLDPAEPLRPLPKVGVGEGAARYPLTVRWSDLDAYGHVNNVKFYDFVQEARVAIISATLDWSAGVVWSVVRQDLDYLKPLDFRCEPYEVATSVVAVGNRSFTLAAEIRDPATGTTYARARTVAVGPRPLDDGERRALSTWALPGAVGVPGA